MKKKTDNSQAEPGEMPHVYAWEWSRNGLPKNSFRNDTREIVAASTAKEAQEHSGIVGRYPEITQVGHEVALAACFPGIVFYRRASDDGETAYWYQAGKTDRFGRNKGRTIKEWLESLKPKPVPTKGDALLSIAYHTARNDTMASYAGLKRALRTLGIEEGGDDWHRFFIGCGYHDAKTREPYPAFIAKPRPKSFRLEFVRWECRGREVDAPTEPGTNAAKIAKRVKEAGIELSGYRKRTEAEAAAEKLRKPDGKTAWPRMKAEPVFANTNEEDEAT